MEALQELLSRFIELLEEENRLLIQSVKDKDAAQKLLELVTQKESVLKEIVRYNKEELQKHEDLLKRIDELTQRNRALAINNIEFINEIFDAIFSVNAPTQYTKNGSLSAKKEGLFNKKA